MIRIRDVTAADRAWVREALERAWEFAVVVTGRVELYHFGAG